MSRLDELTLERAENWVELGRILEDLESYSMTSPSGRAWQYVLRERLAALGVPVSKGHLYKIRRAYNFVKSHAPPDLPAGALERAKLSAVDVAERLFKVDPEQGLQALADALALHPATHAELQRRYNRALRANPQRRNPLQLAWEARRAMANSPAAETASLSETPNAPPSDAVANQGPSDDLRSDWESLVRQVWLEGRRVGEYLKKAELEVELQRLRDLIAEQDAQIATLQKGLDLLGGDLRLVNEDRGIDLRK